MPTSLMAFTIPEVLPIPIPGLSTAGVIPTGIISYQIYAKRLGRLFAERDNRIRPRGFNPGTKSTL